MAKAQRVNQWIGKTAIVSIVIALCAASAHAIWPGAESIKIAPLTLVLESSGLKGDALVSETQAARQLFDRSTTTAYAPQATREIIATLEGKNTIHAIKIFGAAPYRLRVDADQSGAWSSLAGLQNIDLSHLSHDWNSILLATATQTGRLRFTLTPIASSIVTSEKHDEKDDHERSDREKTNGLPELEIWGEGTRFNLKSAAALRDSLDSKGEVPAQGRQYLAAPEQGVIGAPDKMTDDLADNTFTVKLPRNPADYKRIYLAYEVNGIAHWVHALRQINGNAAQGGFGLPISESWTAQLEEINPAWLKQGDNAITFAPPKGETGSFTVRNVRLLGELDNGSNFIMHASGNATETDTEAQSVLDGDNSTGWKPYGASSDDGTPKLTLVFDKPTQVSDLKFFLSNQLKGRFQIEYLKDEKHWMSPAREAIEGKNLTAGWNMIDAPSGGTVNGMRLVFIGGAGSSADIRELVVSGSSAGDTWPAAINVSYPDAGQYFGRVAYLRGYLQPVANNSGAAELTVAGKRVAQTDGAFGVTISKDDIGLKKQGDRSAWSVNVKATYPDGKTVSRTIKLNNYVDAIDPKDTKLPSTYKKVAKPGQHEKLEFDGAGIELSGTEIGKDITLGIRALTARELSAVNQGMTNVTKAGQGYRFTPTPMKFNSQLKVAIPYDPALLPKGKTEKDIKTFYFDIAANRWRELQRFAIDKTQHKIISLSDHFTDMINATVTVPEHPDAVSFNPNSIKDIKAADPGSAINLIEPPKPNNTGDARLSYPIEIPPGRQGLQPNLSVNYSSGGGNGWMGLGWDIPQQSISIDTRWGVPRYDAENETETYLLDGEQLTPVAHRSSLLPRNTVGTPEGKIFHTRIEGAFRKIQRHGTLPDNYWWEVTDKNGMRYIYGGSIATQSVDRFAVLSAPCLAPCPAPGTAGNVFKWMLKEIRDRHNNTVRYHYDVVTDTTSAQPGSQIYLSRITYTGTGGADGPYEVIFTRQGGRTDVMIDARAGFKTIMNQRLTGIDVKYNNARIRSYKFNYDYGAFKKTLLQSVSQYGENGEYGPIFNTHVFKYYDDARNNGVYNGFAENHKEWNSAHDLAGETLLGQGAPSGLGGSSGRNTGGAIYLGIGVGSETTSKENSIGLKLGYSKGENETLLTLSDMNGDGLPDKVFKSGGKYHYRPNLAATGQTGFGNVEELENFPAISKDKVTVTTKGLENYFIYPLLFDVSDTYTQSDTYLSDVNGDGITDVVDNSAVKFGHVGSTGGKVTFLPDASSTPAPIVNVIGNGNVTGEDLLPDSAAIEAAREATYPLLDTVRRWVAPFDGVIKIEAPVKLVEDTSDERRKYLKPDLLTKADGVRVAIQHEDEELWFTQIGPDDYGVHLPASVDTTKDLNALTVKKGDRLYFRVQSIRDGAYDKVNWSPVITYVAGDAALLDENLRSASRYSAKDDFVFFGRRSPVKVPVKGTVHITGILEKTAATTDDVTVLITKNGVDVMRKVMAASDTYSSIDLSQDIQVEPQDQLEWRLITDTPIDLTRVRIKDGSKLSAYYTEAFTPPPRPTGVGDPLPVQDANGKYTIQLNPSQAFIKGGDGGYRTVFKVPYTGTLHLDGRLFKTAATSSDMTLLIAKNGMKFKEYPMAKGAIIATNLAQDVEVEFGDVIELRFLPYTASDLAVFKFRPAAPLVAYYTRAFAVPAQTGSGSPIVVQDDTTKRYILQLEPVFDVEGYPTNDLTAPREGYAVKQNGKHSLTISIRAMTLYNNPPMTFSVKGQGKLIRKYQFELPAAGVDLNSGQPKTVTKTFTLDIDAKKGDKLYFDFTANDMINPSEITGFHPNMIVDRSVEILPPAAAPDPKTPDIIPNPPVPTPVANVLNYSLRRFEDIVFHASYRGWSSFGYNGNKWLANPGGTCPPSNPCIEQAALITDREAYKSETGVKVRIFGYSAKPEQELIDQVSGQVIQTLPAVWGGVDDNAWVHATEMSSSRLGLDDVNMVNGTGFSTASAVPRMSHSKSTGLSIGVGGSQGDSESRLDFMDLNGDRFPDVVSQAGVQFSTMGGGLGNRFSPLGTIRKTTNEYVNLSFSGLASIGHTIPKASAMSTPNSGGPAAGAKNGPSEPSFDAQHSRATSKTENDLIDINGDGLPDMVYQDGMVQLNLGYSFGNKEMLGLGPVNPGETENTGVSMGFATGFGSLAGGLSMGIGNSRTKETYIDINGDGLADKVKREGGALKVAFNNGASYSNFENWAHGHGDEGISHDQNFDLGGGAYFTFGFTFTVVPVKVVISPGFNMSNSLGRPELAFRDMDGDGYVDHVQSTSDDQIIVATNPIRRTNLLKSVTRPLGASFELDYERDGNTYEVPQARWNLSSTRVFDGVDGDGVDTLLATYKYYDVTDPYKTHPDGKYDRNEREFLGYAAVTEEQRNVITNAVYRKTVREFYNNSYYTKGLLWRERMVDANNSLYTQTENTYALRDIFDNNILKRNDLEKLDEFSRLTTKTFFPMLERTDNRYYEGMATAGKATYAEYIYDQRGNVTKFMDYGDSGDADNVVADISYSQCEGTHIVGKPLTITVTGNGKLMRQRVAIMPDCTTGDITEVQQLLETAQTAVTTLGYYENGNLKRVMGPANYKNDKLVVKYDYDQAPGVQTYITRITSESYDLNSRAEYNYKYGKPEITTDTNGNVTRMAYDQFGRVEKVFGPYEQGDKPTIRFEYHPEAADAVPRRAPYAISYHLDKDANGQPKASDTIDTILFTDGLKRVIQTKKDATIHVSPAAGTQDVMTISGRVNFDAMGRTIEQYYPTTEAKGSNYAFNPTANLAAKSTRTSYDVLDRTVRTDLPDDTYTTMVYGFGGDRNGLTQFMTTVYDANGRKKESYRDVRELITTVNEFNGGQTIQTSYVYDPLKQITQVIDDHHNVTNVYYDNLGRRTVIDNADTGRTETVYDTAGNVTRKVTANLKGQGKSVLYDYDHNRLTAISYPLFPANNVSYTYGASGDAWNRAGRIATVVHAAGVEARYYGKLGETVKENFCRRSSHCSKPSDADQPNAQPSSSAITDALHAGSEDLHDIEHDNEHTPLYVTQYVYDTFGRMQRLTYPDGEVLTYGYDAGGLVNKATGVKGKFSYPYLKRLDYDKFDQRVYLQLGNGVETSYTYRQDNRRLDALQAQLPNVTHYRFQNLGYRYDNVGNILGISNNSLYPEGQQGIGEEVGGPVTQSYVYDDLYRLTQANGEYRHNANDLRRYRMSMGYDSIHNILAKEQLDEEIEQENGKTETEVEHETSYTYGYQYAAPQTGSNAGSIHPHAPSEIGNYSFQYDANGNQLERRYRDDENTRQIVWDEDNRMGCVHEFEHEHPSQVIAQIPVNCSSTAEKLNHDDRNILNGSHTPEVRFVYNDRGERVFKESDENVSFYLNPHYTEKSDDAYKHILIGTTRLVTKEVNTEKTKELEHEQYYYHPDHLGSSSFVTDREGKLEEHLEYFPFGETWIEEESSLPIAFRFTAKELDGETGLYYFGARYYDPRTSVWQSADPILGKYLSGKVNGGVINSKNLGLYSYAYGNPVMLLDPDGNDVVGIAMYNQNAPSNEKNAFNARALHAVQAEGGSRANVQSVQTGQGFINVLIQASRKEPINKLYVSSHSGLAGLYGDSNSGFYSGPVAARINNLYQDGIGGYAPPTDAAAYISDLSDKVKSGEIRFAENAEIVFLGCNTSKGLLGGIIDSFGEDLSEALPGLKVTGAQGYVAPANPKDKNESSFAAFAENDPNSDHRDWVTNQDGSQVKNNGHTYTPGDQ